MQVSEACKHHRIRSCTKLEHSGENSCSLGHETGAASQPIQGTASLGSRTGSTTADQAKGSRSRNADKARRPSPLERCERGERAGGPREEKREGTRARLEAGAPARLFLLRGGESAQPRSCTHRKDENEAATALPALSARPLRPPRPRRPPGPTWGPPGAHLSPAGRPARCPGSTPPHLGQAAAGASVGQTEGRTSHRHRFRRAGTNESAIAAHTRQ